MHYGFQKVKVVVVSASSVFGFGGVLLWAMIHSAASTLGTCLVSREDPEVLMTIDGVASWPIVRGILIVGLLTAVAIPWLYRHMPGWRIVLYAALYALGLLMWKEAVIIPLWRADIAPAFLFPTGETIMFLFTSNLLATGFVSCCVAWLVCRWTRGPIIQQDGTLCPNCAYSLVGSSEEVCSECGREFTFQELGTTPERLRCTESPQERLTSPSIVSTESK